LFVLGHVGIGTRLLFGLRRRMPPRWLIAGCLLPDLIDKPLFYVLLWTRGTVDPLITGSRSIGHSGLFLLALIVLALISRRAEARALAAGVVTHLVLDIGGELLTGARPDSSIWIAILFPAYGWRFPVAHFDTLLEHLRLSAESLYVITGEIVGGAILLRDFRARPKAHSS
jgi:LexA-binding, inner membrane-associated putative hydrolase